MEFLKFRGPDGDNIDVLVQVHGAGLILYQETFPCDLFDVGEIFQQSENEERLGSETLFPEIMSFLVSLPSVIDLTGNASIRGD